MSGVIYYRRGKVMSMSLIINGIKHPVAIVLKHPVTIT